MPVYEYSALTLKGKTVNGIIDAESSAAARLKLKGTGVFPVSVEQTREEQKPKSEKAVFLRRSFTRVKPADLAMLTRQLATLLSAGFPLVNALDTLIPQARTKSLNRILARTKDAIVEGNSFATALSKYPGAFSPIYINMVHAGESSGTLEIVLERLADISEKQQALNTRIRSALAYPIFMLVVGLIVLLVLLAYIVPNITSIFADLNQTLPLPTRLLISTSEFLKSFWWVFLAVLIMGILALRRLTATGKGRLLRDRFLLSAPIFGNLLQKLAVARFARTLGSLLENGVSMLAAMDIVRNIVGNQVIADAIANASREIGKGEGLSASLAPAGVFPSLSVQMIQVGEQSGEMEKMLNKIAEVYENEVEAGILGMTSLLEPLMILVMGGLVGFIVVSICLPIFEMNQLIK